MSEIILVKVLNRNSLVIKNERIFLNFHLWVKLKGLTQEFYNYRNMENQFYFSLFKDTQL